MPEVEYFVGSTEGNADQWYFHIKGANGEIMMVSEAYDSESNAKRGFKDLALAIEEIRKGMVDW